MQLTIPGELNVAGGALLGSATISIGHSAHVAWSHTVATGVTLNLHQLTLDPADPTSYVVDGQPERMTKRTVTVDLHDASLAERIAGDQSSRERDHALAPLDRAQRRPVLAATVVAGDHVLALEVGQAGEVAALRGVRKAGQQCGVFCVGEGELVAPGGSRGRFGIRTGECVSM